MTDGCGFMNKAGECSNMLLSKNNHVTEHIIVALQIQRLLNLKFLPTAVQARIGGVKGMVSR